MAWESVSDSILIECVHARRRGPLRTHCRHDAIRGDSKSKSVPNSACEACEFFKPGEHAVTQKVPLQTGCSHRGEVARSVECKSCGGRRKPFVVHACDIHGECAKDDYVFEKLRENGVKVKSCAACSDRSVKLPQVDVLYFRHHGNKNQDTIAGIEELRESGISAELVGASNSTDFESFIHEHTPRLVINRAMAIPFDVIEKLSVELPDVQFLTTCHSSPSHLMFHNGLIDKWVRFWELSKDRENCWVGTPDFKNPFDGHERSVWLPNPIKLKEHWNQKPLGSPVRFSLCGRRDMIKNFPNQIIALGRVARTHNVHLSLCIRGETSDLQSLAKTVGIPVESRPWSDSESFKNWISESIDIGLCCSYSETFCYVALDHYASGVPVVGSQAVSIVDPPCRVNPDDPEAIADGIRKIANRFSIMPIRARSIAETVASENNQIFAKTVKRLCESSTSTRRVPIERDQFHMK